MKIIKRYIPKDPFNTNPDYLFFSDLHLHDRKEFHQIDSITGLNTRLAEGLSVLDQIISIAKNHPSIRAIFHLGDIFERKDNVPNQILIEFKNRLRIIRDDLDIPFYSLKGNHDFNLPKYPTLLLFGDILFIDTPTLLSSYKIYFLPYQERWEQFEKAWIEAHKFHPSIICLHQDIPGGVYESGKSIVGTWTLKTDPNILYLSGHLHRPQKVNEIQFLGSPYQVRFSDEWQDHYIWLYNSESKSLDKFQLNYSKFISLNWYELNNVLPEHIKEAVKGNYVRIIGDVFKEDYDSESKKVLKSNLEKMGAKVVIFQVRIQKQSQIEIPEENVSNDLEIIRNYAQKNVMEGLDLSELIKKGQIIYESL